MLAPSLGGSFFRYYYSSETVIFKKASILQTHRLTLKISSLDQEQGSEAIHCCSQTFAERVRSIARKEKQNISMGFERTEMRNSSVICGHEGRRESQNRDRVLRVASRIKRLLFLLHPMGNSDTLWPLLQVSLTYLSYTSGGRRGWRNRNEVYSLWRGRFFRFVQVVVALRTQKHLTGGLCGTWQPEKLSRSKEKPSGEPATPLKLPLLLLLLHSLVK